MVKKISKRIDLTEDGLFSSINFNPFDMIKIVEKETISTPWWLKRRDTMHVTYISDFLIQGHSNFYLNLKEEIDKFNLNDGESFNCHLCGRRLSLWKYSLCDKCNKELDLIRQNAERL